MKCRCRAFYIRKTKRHFGQRTDDHTYYSGGGKIITPVTRHVGLHHKYHTEMVSFFVLEVIPPDPRGGNWDKRILQRETLWIDCLNAITPPGINEVNSYMPFLRAFLVLWTQGCMCVHLCASCMHACLSTVFGHNWLCFFRILFSPFLSFLLILNPCYPDAFFNRCFMSTSNWVLT